VQSPSENREKRQSLRLFCLGVLSSERFWQGFCLCSGAILAWAGRYAMNTDGLSYLDIASNAASKGPAQLINDYWSPAYPGLLSVALFLFRPSSHQEFPVVHLVNFGIYIFALWTFSFFLRNWLRFLEPEQAVSGKQNWLIPFGFCIFLTIATRFIGIDLVTPDLLVAAVVFLAGAVSCRLALQEADWKQYGLLGLVLGAGYYVKAALLPLGILLLLLLFLSLLSKEGRDRRRRFFSLGFSFLIFALFAAPLVTLMSSRESRLSIGETGRLNYAWWVSGVPTDLAVWSQGISASYARPEHPPRVLAQKPVVLEFAAPIAGTYPLWYDPSYWYAGAKATFDLRKQLVATGEVLQYYGLMCDAMMPLLGGAIVLFAFRVDRNAQSATRRDAWWLIGWPLAACSMYALVTVEWRYVAAFFSLFWLGLFRILAARARRRVALPVCATVIAVLMLSFLRFVESQTIHITKDLIHPRLPDYEVAALGLRDLGLRNGDRVAVVGTGSECFYCRYDRLRIVAEIADEREFWRLSNPELRTLEGLLASAGVRALVASNRPENAGGADWKDVPISGSDRLSVLLLFPEPVKGR
jgi:hypothetical protein